MLNVFSTFLSLNALGATALSSRNKVALKLNSSKILEHLTNMKELRSRLDAGHFTKSFKIKDTNSSVAQVVGCNIPEDMDPFSDLGVLGACGSPMGGSRMGSEICGGHASPGGGGQPVEQLIGSASSYPHSSSSEYSGEPRDSGDMTIAGDMSADEEVTSAELSSSIRSVWKPPLLDQRRFMVAFRVRRTTTRSETTYHTETRAPRDTTVAGMASAVSPPPGRAASPPLRCFVSPPRRCFVYPPPAFSPPLQRCIRADYVTRFLALSRQMRRNVASSIPLRFLFRPQLCD